MAVPHDDEKPKGRAYSMASTRRWKWSDGLAGVGAIAAGSLGVGALGAYVMMRERVLYSSPRP